MKNIVGLFGTCGDSKWRDPFIALLNESGINYFDHVKKDWNGLDSVIEAEYLHQARILLFVITCETTSYGSLAEVGWAAKSAQVNSQTLILYVEDYKGEDPSGDASRVRRLVLSHAKTAGINIVTTLLEAFEQIKNLTF